MAPQSRTRKVLTLTILLTAILVGMYQTYYRQYGQFYPSMRQFARNNQAMLLAFVQWLCIVYLSTKGVIRLFFGDLRAIEQENVSSNFWLSITDTALTMTIFHDDLQKEAVSFVVLFTALLAFKILHWLFHDRVDFMETSPIITWKFRARMIFLTVFLLATDAFTVWYSYEKIMQRKDYWLVFANEYALLTAYACHVFVKFLLHSVDLASSSPWINKNSYMMFVRLFFTTVRLVVQACFVFFLTKRVQFPLYAVRPVFVEAKILRNTIRDIIRSRQALRRLMGFPDATVADFADPEKDSTCIICHDDMISGEGANRTITAQLKKLPCGHIFHAGCLRSWFLRQQTCPICRQNVLEGAVGGTTPHAAAAAGFNPRGGAAANAQDEAQRIRDIIQNIQAQHRQVVNGGGAAGAGQQAAQPGGENAPLSGVAAEVLFSTNRAPQVTSAALQTQIPYSVPIPRPPIAIEQLSQLSDEELREMEGQERQAMIKRIEYLRQVRSMCDATLTMMSQYNTVTNPSSIVAHVAVQANIEPQHAESSSPKTPISPTEEETSDPPTASATEAGDMNELRRRRVQALAGQAQ